MVTSLDKMMNAHCKCGHSWQYAKGTRPVCVKCIPKSLVFTLAEIEKFIENLIVRNDTIPFSSIVFCRQLADTMRERDRYKKLWEKMFSMDDLVKEIMDYKCRCNGFADIACDHIVTLIKLHEERIHKDVQH